MRLPDILEVADGVVVVLDEGQHLAGAVPGVAGEVEFDPRATAGQAHLADTGQVVPCQAQLSQTHTHVKAGQDKLCLRHTKLRGFHQCPTCKT